jgi:hypothetical protein
MVLFYLENPKQFVGPNHPTELFPTELWLAVGRKVGATNTVYKAELTVNPADRELLQMLLDSDEIADLRLDYFIGKVTDGSYMKNFKTYVFGNDQSIFLSMEDHPAYTGREIPILANCKKAGEIPARVLFYPSLFEYSVASVSKGARLVLTRK